VSLLPDFELEKKVDFLLWVVTRLLEMLGLEVVESGDGFEIVDKKGD